MKIIVSTEEIYMLTFELVYRYEVAVGTTPGGGQIKPFFSVPVDTQYYTVTGLALDGLTKVKKGVIIKLWTETILQYTCRHTILYCNRSSLGWSY